MRLCRKNWNVLPWLCLVSLSIANSLQAADEKTVFRPGEASSYSNRQKQGSVVVAAAAYVSDEQAKTAFGKVNPYEHGVLPVLLVLENGGKQVLKLDNMRVQYIDSARHKLDNIPAKDVPYLRAPKRPNMNTPLPGIKLKRKNPLSAIEIDSRAFAAKMLPPGDHAHGFFYFQTDHRPGAILYVTGIAEAATGKELFFFEVPLDTESK